MGKGKPRNALWMVLSALVTALFLVRLVFDVQRLSRDFHVSPILSLTMMVAIFFGALILARALMIARRRR